MKSIILLTTSFFLIFSVNAQYLSKVAPEEVGMDSKRLQQTDLIINQAIADKDGCKHSIRPCFFNKTNGYRYLCNNSCRTGKAKIDR